MTAPAISVVMPAYNGAALIGETLASVAAQTFTDYEVLVVDDCSTDGTRDLLRNWPDPRVRLIEAPVNGGPVRARNRAVAEARGRYLAALDQDDLCHADRFARQVAWLDADPGCVLVATDADVLEDGVIEASQRPPNTTPALLAWMAMLKNPFVWSSVMIRAAAARRFDPFSNPDRLYAEDFDLYHRLARVGRIARIDAPLVTYRDHSGGVSKLYADTMLASTVVVLTEAYGPALGREAEPAALLVAEHIMATTPVPDRATLRLLGGFIGRLQAHHLATHELAREDVTLIKWTTARLWWKIARHAIRSGKIGVGDAVAVRPDHLGLGYAGLDDLLVSGVVGRLRSLRQGHSS
jgi:hypothetical protein